MTTTARAARRPILSLAVVVFVGCGAAAGAPDAASLDAAADRPGRADGSTSTDVVGRVDAPDATLLDVPALDVAADVARHRDAFGLDAPRDVATPDARVACTAPQADCDGNAANGCETDLATSAASCGTCGRSCGTAACAAGACQPEVVLDGVAAHRLAVEGGYVYYLTGFGVATGSVGRVATRGGSPSPVALGLNDVNGGFAVSGGFVYFDDTASEHAAIERVAVDGTGRAVLARWNNQGGLAADGTSVFAFDPCFPGDPLCPVPNVAAVVRVPAAGGTLGAARLVDQSDMQAVATDGA